MGVKLGVMTTTCAFIPLEKVLREISGMGVRYVEIMCERPHMYPGDYSFEDRMRVKALCDELGLTIVGLDAMHCSFGTIGVKLPPSPFDGVSFPPDPKGFEPMLTCPIPEVRRAKIDYIKQCVDMAADMGVPMVEFFTGLMLAPWDDTYSSLIESLRELTSYAAEKKITLTLEMGRDLMCGDPDEIVELVKTLNSPWVKLCVDIGHAHIEGLDIPGLIHKMRDHIINFHLEDIRHRKHFHMPVGRGDINWREYLKALDEIGYNSTANFEIYHYALDPIPILKESYSYLTNLINEI